MTSQVLEKLKSVEARYEELTRLISDATVQADPPTYRKHMKALADIEDLVDRYRQYAKTTESISETRELAESGDAEMKALAAEEIRSLETSAAALEKEIQHLLIPKDPNDDRN